MNYIIIGTPRRSDRSALSEQVPVRRIVYSILDVAEALSMHPAAAAEKLGSLCEVERGCLPLHRGRLWELHEYLAATYEGDEI